MRLSSLPSGWACLAYQPWRDISMHRCCQCDEHGRLEVTNLVYSIVKKLAVAKPRLGPGKLTTILYAPVLVLGRDACRWAERASARHNSPGEIYPKPLPEMVAYAVLHGFAGATARPSVFLAIR